MNRAGASLPLPGAASQERRGFWLGLAGVLMFALSIPMTRLAGGPVDDPQLPPAFVAIGRAAVAGLLSIGWLLLTRAPWPRRDQWLLLALSAAGVVFGFPLFSGWAVRYVEAVHAAVITGFLPLATAVVGAWWLRQRPPAAFWACAVFGCALVATYAWLKGGGGFHLADGLLLLAVLSAAVGYVGGARLTGDGLNGPQVICWMLVLCLPLTLPLTAWQATVHWSQIAPGGPVRLASWAGFVYVSTVSMWLGFFAWYRGLALGGTLRVSQVQLVQPFASMLAAVPLLGERLDLLTVGFALAVIATVFVGKQLPARPQPRRHAMN
jgi:drug/metabolite transporter (DMT)-like permease